MEKAKKIIWTEPAKKDLKDIFEFISDFSYEIADKTVDKIIEKTGLLLVSGFEYAGQTDNINTNYRRLIVGSYKILYKVHSSDIVIYGIFDTRRDHKELEKL